MSGPATSYRIELGQEELIPVENGLARFLARTVGGPRIHNSTAYRWVQKGVKGWRLPAVRVNRKLYTTKGAVSWWCRQLVDAVGDDEFVGDAPQRLGADKSLDVLRAAGILAPPG